ncbi:valine--tRNA ligase, mitochondrial-like [Cynoglossus semilaevis]|uniref:valine--tRNA ligase, mitochondrial-like n=1 Tax=Cynoglossus semilaevis TaxID=244447 RepID=UPI0007DC9BB0|nr:valine--tRNA ligase, mitochondrial-like [Cynoglossus semilaevis]
MAKNAIKVVEDGELKIVPHFYAKSWRTWLSNISDWCISRQLWWGHQIPAYQVELPDSRTNTEEERWVWGRTEDEARQRAAVKYGVHPTSVNLTRGDSLFKTTLNEAFQTITVCNLIDRRIFSKAGSDDSSSMIWARTDRGDDISLSVSQVLSCRHFCNKMWQTVRFTLGVLEHTKAPIQSLEQCKPPPL